MFTRPIGLLLASLAAGLAAGGCGGQSGAAPQAPVSSAAASGLDAGKPAARPTRPSHLWRSDMMPVLSAGLQRFLPLVEIKPAMAKGRFYGWRIVALHWEGTPLAGVDVLRPGDVVISVNGRPIERPEQMHACWLSLTMANELRIAYERNDEKRQLAYTIDDDPPAAK
jgi:S1-C subfamily serine protease